MRKKEYPYQNFSLKEMKGEQWEEIPGLDGFYLISNLGRIRSLPRYIEKINAIRGYWTKERILAQTVTCKRDNRYTGQSVKHLNAIIRYQNRSYHFTTSRLVYNIFVEEINMDEIEVFIKYKDGDSLNCRSTNLISATHSEHMKSCYRNGQLKSPYNEDPSRFKNLMASKKPVRRVCQYTNKGELVKIYESQRIASTETGIDNSVINGALKGKSKTAGSYIWRYEGEKFGDKKARLERASFNGRKRIVTQYDANGKRVAIYYSVKDAQQAVGANVSQILRSTRSEYLSAKGFFWRTGEGGPEIDTSAYWNRLAKNIRSQSRIVEQYDLKGRKVHTYESIKEAAQKTAICASTIARTARRKSKIFGGYIWRLKK